jgi:orotate phosphoribosyltransferase
MQSRAKKIQSAVNPSLQMEILPGHFATRNSHVNYYLNMTEIKSKHSMAREAGRFFASMMASSTPVETIVCLDGTEVVAAYLAEALTKAENGNAMAGSNIDIVTPEFNHSGQFIFRDNVQSMIWNRQVLLLAASTTTGTTIEQAIQCIHYYHGIISSLAAIFSAVERIQNYTVHAIFGANELPDYEVYTSDNCPECKAGAKIDALVNSYGYSRL